MTRANPGCREDPPTSELPSPKLTSLPFFAYGLFKPGELAYQQIQNFIEGSPVMAWVRGSLWARDGLPLLKPGDNGRVSGYLLDFRKDKANEAYALVSRFEPKQHYCWEEIDLSVPMVRANSLVGRWPERASVRIEEAEWTGRRDPVLTVGLSVVSEIAEQYASDEFVSGPPDSFDWPRLFRLQMAYLLLWTAIERYAALSYGPNTDPMEKVRRFGQDPAFERSLKRVVTETRKVYDSRDPKKSEALDPGEPSSAVMYYYLGRSNLSHRGKGAWRDGEIVRKSLLELQEIFAQVLKERLPGWAMGAC